jgi:hypothetical protein
MVFFYKTGLSIHCKTFSKGPCFNRDLWNSSQHTQPLHYLLQGRHKVDSCPHERTAVSHHAVNIFTPYSPKQPKWPILSVQWGVTVKFLVQADETKRNRENRKEWWRTCSILYKKNQTWFLALFTNKAPVPVDSKWETWSYSYVNNANKPWMQAQSSSALRNQLQ